MPFQSWQRRRLDLNSSRIASRFVRMQTCGSLIHAVCFACNLNDRPTRESDNSFLRWATIAHIGSRIAFGSDYRTASSSVSYKVGQRGILIDSLKRTSDASSRSARTHMCDDVYEKSEIDVNGDEKKEGLACKNGGSREYTRVRRKELMAATEREREPHLARRPNSFFRQLPCFEKPMPLTSRPHRIRFYPCS